jgi:hypothetical protein
MGLDLCHGSKPGGIAGLRPEIVGQSALHQPAKMQKQAETTCSLASWREVTECFLLGSLVAQAPFYSGILQGLQVSDVTPYS